VSAYGTYDQTGDVFQWNENLDNGLRIVRGGSFDDLGDFLPSTFYGNQSMTDEADDIGFRIAKVPEPASIAV